MPNDNEDIALSKTAVTSAENKSDEATVPSSKYTSNDSISCANAAHCTGNEDEEADYDSKLLEKLRGDAVGETMFSKRFILQTLVRLSQVDGALGEELENDLCKLWDMSVSSDVVALLVENGTIELLIYAIESSDDVRLYEITVGLLGNMCAQIECVEQLTANADWVETLLKLSTCMDMPMLLQLMRVYQYIMAHVKDGKEQLGINWYKCFAAFDNSAKNMGFILQQSVSEELISAALKAVNAVLASCALIEEENADSDLNLKPFSEIFLVKELCDGVNNAFLRLMLDDKDKQTDGLCAEDNAAVNNFDEDDDGDSDVCFKLSTPKISCDPEVIQTYLNICTILVQLPQVQVSVNISAPNIMVCLTRILQYLQQPTKLVPLDERQEEILEDLTHICNCLNHFYENDAFISLLGVWLKLRQHISKYKETNETDFEVDDDAPLAQYVDNAYKLLRLLANILTKVDESARMELKEVSTQNVQVFLTSLSFEQDAVFQKAYEKFISFLESNTKSQKT